MPEYKHPPIIEAVIEVRFATELAQEAIDSANKKLKESYSFSTLTQERQVDLEMGEDQLAVEVSERPTSYKLVNQDRTDLVVIRPGGLGWSRLAPYGGWESFSARTRRDWRAWKRAAGYKKIAQIGVRYINRLDMPLEGRDTIQISDYIAISPTYPETGLLPTMSTYTMQVEFRLPDDKCNLVINSAIVEPVLINHSAVILDIDVVRTEDVPQKDDDIWSFINRLRDIKNDIFETIVTDKARELFDR